MGNPFASGPDNSGLIKAQKAEAQQQEEELARKKKKAAQDQIDRQRAAGSAGGFAQGTDNQSNTLG